MRAHVWTSLLGLVFLAGGPTAAGELADDVQELSRSVRWSNLALRETPPEDLSVDVPRDAAKLRYAEFVYGTPDSRRVAVVAAQTADSDFVLYADQNRDRNISEEERVQGAGEFRRLTLAAEKVAGVLFEEFPRQVLFRWQGGRADAAVATTTCIERTIYPDGDETGRALKTRQIDGNANGLFADTKDWLQIDLNDDDRITEMIVTLSGEDGSVYSLMGADATTDLPVGRYAAAGLFVVVQAARTDRAWEFTFSRDGDIRAQDWLRVNEGKTVEIDPIGDLVLDAEVEVEGGTGACRCTKFERATTIVYRFVPADQPVPSRRDEFLVRAAVSGVAARRR